MGIDVSRAAADWIHQYTHRTKWLFCKDLLCSVREYRLHLTHSGLLATLRQLWAVLCYQFYSKISGANIPCDCQIGGAFLLSHPNVIAINPAAKIGLNCLIFPQVTLSARGTTDAPVLANDVDDGAGAKFSGCVQFGELARVGANALVLVDPPTHPVAAPVPKIASGFSNE